MTYRLDFADVDEFVEILKASGIRSATVNTDEVQVPGVLVQVTGLNRDTLDGGLTLRCRLLLLAPLRGVRREMAILQDLFNQVEPVLEALGVVTPGDVLARPVVLPGQPNALPGLAIPLDLHTQE